MSAELPLQAGTAGVCGTGDNPGWAGEGGHSLLQDTELFILLEAQVSVVRRHIAVQGDNQVVCKDRGSQGEDFWSRLGG